MGENRRTIVGIISYVTLTFALSSVFYRGIILHGMYSQGLIAGLMWCPGFAGLLTRLAYQRTLRGAGWGWGKWKYQWWSYCIPILYSAAVYLPLWAVGYGDFHSKTLERFATAVHIAGRARPLIVLVYIVLVGTLGMIGSCASALGEELGWRGFLVPELAKVTSFTRVSLISGAIWATWHIPIVIGASYRGAGPVWYSILCFAVLVVSASFLFAWMRLKSGSVWTGMLLHASHNLFIQAIFDPLTRRSALTNYVTGEFGAGLAVAAMVVAFVCWRKQKELCSIMGRAEAESPQDPSATRPAPAEKNVTATTS
jgi:uncharacterized protein